MSMPSSNREAPLRLAALGALGPALMRIQDREVSGWLASEFCADQALRRKRFHELLPELSDLAGELPRERFRVQTPSPALQPRHHHP